MSLLSAFFTSLGSQELGEKCLHSSALCFAAPKNTKRKQKNLNVELLECKTTCGSPLKIFFNHGILHDCPDVWPTSLDKRWQAYLLSLSAVVDTAMVREAVEVASARVAEILGRHMLRQRCTAAAPDHMNIFASPL